MKSLTPFLNTRSFVVRFGMLGPSRLNPSGRWDVSYLRIILTLLGDGRGGGIEAILERFFGHLKWRALLRDIHSVADIGAAERILCGGLGLFSRGPRAEDIPIPREILAGVRATVLLLMLARAGELRAEADLIKSDLERVNKMVATSTPEAL